MIETDIDDLIAGDSYDVIRIIDSIPSDQSIADAWMTVKENAWDAEPVFQKHITDSISSGGIIEDTGAEDTIGRLRFTLLHEETALLSPFFKYVFDIQIKTNADKIYTPEVGSLTARAEVTTDA